MHHRPKSKPKLKFPEDNIENIGDLGFGDDFFGVMPKA